MRLLLVFWLFGLLLRLSQAQVHNNTSLEWTPRSLARLLQQCLSGAEVWQCLGSQTERLLDAAGQDNSTWKLSEYLSIEPQERKAEEQQGRQAKGLTGKLLELAQGRALRVRMPRQLTISNAIDEFGNGLGLDQGRKKKDKDKNMAMMGGMIMLATFAQMFLGKVILIAGAAFIMAKIALVIALLGSLKKGSAGQSGSKPEPHVIVTGGGHGGGGHSHESGWHRSMPTLDYSAMPPPMHNEEESHPGHEQAYQAYEVERIGRRQMMNDATAKPGFL